MKTETLKNVISEIPSEIKIEQGFEDYQEHLVDTNKTKFYWIIAILCVIIASMINYYFVFVLPDIHALQQQIENFTQIK